MRGKSREVRLTRREELTRGGRQLPLKDSFPLLAVNCFVVSCDSSQVRELKKRQQKQQERERKLREKQLDKDRSEKESQLKLKVGSAEGCDWQGGDGRR